MRMDQRQELTADTLVNSASEQDLIRIIRDYGEEPKAKAIARRIIENRPLHDTGTLATLVAKSYGPWARKSRTHPATKTFQALRIAVNDELGQLGASLPLMASLLAPGGRLAIISFHSLEDRLVKQFFAENAGDRYDTELRSLTKKPVTAGKKEISFNPRARSAKLRAASKIKTN
jgi:16S rRNA (cytosine1402-N4)-methyltransferase